MPPNYADYSVPKLVQIVATGKAVAVPDWLFDEWIADGRGRAAMIKQVYLGAPSRAEELNPDLVVVEVHDLVNLW